MFLVNEITHALQHYAHKQDMLDMLKLCVTMLNLTHLLDINLLTTEASKLTTLIVTITCVKGNLLSL